MFFVLIYTQIAICDLNGHCPSTYVFPTEALVDETGPPYCSELDHYGFSGALIEAVASLRPYAAAAAGITISH